MNTKNKIICITLITFVIVVLTVIFFIVNKNDNIEQDYVEFTNPTEESVNSTVSTEDVLSFVEQNNIPDVHDIKIMSDTDNLKQWEVLCDNGEKYIISIINSDWYISQIDIDEEAD